MCRHLAIALLTLTAVVFTSSTLSAQKTNPASKAQKLLSEIAWIAGNWQGEAMGGSFEESWNPPSGGTMVGMFKFVKDGEVGFYEILTIVPTKDDSLVLRLKHFHADLKGWEEKDDSVEFPFVSASEKEAKFDGLRFVKTGDDTMEIFVQMKSEGKTEELKFACKRRKN